MPLFSLSGGIVYHLRALQHREGLWASYRAELGRWLLSRLGCAEELILVGPSGGHCLPLQHWAACRRLIVLEPDPLAQRILRSRLPGVRVDVEHRDLLFDPLVTRRPGLEAVLDRWPMTPVLFCNLLGQVQLERSDELQDRFQSEFRHRILPRLAGRRWASFHDRWSLDQTPTDTGPVRYDFERLPDDEALGRALFGASGPPVTVFDHGTSHLFPEQLPRTYFKWQLTGKALHVVEGVAER